MEEKIEEIESNIITNFLKKIENAKPEELALYVSAYECFLSCVQSRKFIENDIG